MKKRVLINGALGHMGRAILSAMESGDWDLAPAVGIDLAEGDFPGALFPSAEAVNVPFDVAVDFSRPQATMDVLSLCLREKKPLVTGTTGLSEAQQQASRLKQKAEEEIEQQKKQMLNEVRQDISELAVDIASKVIEREINKGDYDAFVDEFIRNVGDKT